jgi:hypothetical protein
MRVSISEQGANHGNCGLQWPAAGLQESGAMVLLAINTSVGVCNSSMVAILAQAGELCQMRLLVEWMAAAAVPRQRLQLESAP